MHAARADRDHGSRTVGPHAAQRPRDQLAPARRAPTLKGWIDHLPLLEGLRIVRSKLTLVLLFAVGLAVAPGLAPGPGASDAFAAGLPPGGTFLDDDRSVHEGYIEALVDEDVTVGCAEERYCPTDDVTRGQMAAFIRRAFALPASSTDYFQDDDGSMFEADINAIAEADITYGCGDGTRFCPSDEVTRGQMAAFLRRADDLPVPDRNHFDDDGDSVFEDDINAIAAAGVTSGCNPPDNSRFCPEAATTRAQMASFLGRFLDYEATPPPDRDPADLSARDAIRAWFPKRYEQAITVARCESSLYPRAVNHGGDWHGLFQVHRSSHKRAFERVTGQSWSDGIYVAYYNAEYAKDLFERSGGWGPWGCKP